MKNIDTFTPTAKLMLMMIGANAEFERQNLLERQREGIEIAKREDKFKGGQRKKVPDFGGHYQRYMNREISKSKLAAELNIRIPTLVKLIEEYRNENHSLK